ncbi:unnamed protein product, partial [Cylicostephanus goldi]
MSDETGHATNTPIMSHESGTKNCILGAIFILFGVIVQIAYFLEFLVMARKQNRRLSCYKIMISLGIYDIGSMWINSMLTGYFWMTGANYCTNPNLIYISGSLALVLKVVIKMAVFCSLLVCFLYELFHTGDLPHTGAVQQTFDGMAIHGIKNVPRVDNSLSIWSVLLSLHKTPTFQFRLQIMYFNYSQTTNNIFVVAATCLLYPVFTNPAAIFEAQQWIVLDANIRGLLCASICLINLLYASISVYSNFVPTPSYFVYISHICWQLGNGAFHSLTLPSLAISTRSYAHIVPLAFPAFVYLVLNRTIRKE